MIIDKDLQKVLNQLEKGNQINILLEGSDIHVRLIDEASKLSLSTSVYYGGNYIPSSVRNSLLKKQIHFSLLATYLTIDEQNFQINLNYLGRADPLSHSQFRNLIEEFGIIAEKWRLFLDENDKNDLIYVRKI